MRLESHKGAQPANKTVITIIREAIEVWRKPLLKNREDVADDIVKAHHEIGGVESTGIWIEPEGAGRAEALRMKANADRIFRWLDDQDKDNNLLPANFLPSVLAGLPPAVQFACVTEILRPLGLSPRSIISCEGAAAIDVISGTQSLSKEGSEALRSYISLASDASLPALENTYRELTESIDAHCAERAAVEAAITAKKAEAAL